MNTELKEILFGAALLGRDSQHVIECAMNVSNPEDQRQLLCKAIAMLSTAADECRRVKSRLTAGTLDRSEIALLAHAKSGT